MVFSMLRVNFCSFYGKVVHMVYINCSFFVLQNHFLKILQFAEFSKNDFQKAKIVFLSTPCTPLFNQNKTILLQ